MAQVMEGVEWPFGTCKFLMTVFSASNYSGLAKNKGAYASRRPDEP